jgi:aminoglycoside phosphotransferase (APT) family kinase protein
LSFLPGQVPDELGHFSRVQLVAAARLLRSFHDATAGSPLAGSSEVVCHGDASPCNCVFVDGMPTALIDFDAAHPGTRDEDLGYATWLWLDLGNPELAPEFQGQRIAEFFRAYGADPTRAVPAIRSAQSQLAAGRQAPSATQLWARQCSQWLEVHSGTLSRILVEAW